MSFDWKALVGSVAPTLGVALGGPFGGMAGKFIADKLGVDESGLPDAVENATPETMIQIKKLDTDFELQMKELGITEEQLHGKDRASARDLAKSTSIMPQLVLSVVYTVAYAVVLWAFITGKINVPESAQQQFGIVLGVLTAAQTQILNFWFGSSSGSQQKNKIIGQMQ